MMNNVRLRPHHALCAQFFRGKGYDERFVEHMSGVLASLVVGDPAVILTNGCDVICAACPHKVGGTCATDDKVRGIDARAVEAMGLRIGDTLPWRALCERAEREIIRTGKLSDVCRDCEWIGICCGEEEQKN